MNFVKGASDRLQQGYDQVVNKLEDTINQVKDFIDPWNDVTDLMITQLDDLKQCICPCCCEGANKYNIVQVDHEVSEQSGFGARCCLHCWRPFKLQIFGESQTNLEFQSEKPCGLCTITPAMWLNANVPCCCINGCPFARPKIMVSKDSTYIGRVDNPFTIMARTGCPLCPQDELNILDSNNNLKYMVSGNCCQLGQLCRLCGCMCRCMIGNTIDFKILDANKTEVGYIRNIYNGCWKETCTKEDKFLIHFPPQATYNEKILILHAAVMIDFDVFEDTCCHLC